MTHTQRSSPEPRLLDACIEEACRAIAPGWPLDRQIAVNPWWGFIGQPFAQAACLLRRLVGTRFVAEPAVYLEAWRSGEIDADALRRAAAERGSYVTPDSALAVLQLWRASAEGLPLLSDVRDSTAPLGHGPRWKDTVTQQVSQYCASYFDEHQADWQRSRRDGLYGGWRTALLVDHALQPLMHAPEIRARAGALPERPRDAIGWALDRLGLPLEESTDFLRLCLLRINGWASWCAWLGWQAQLAGGADPHLEELLAIRCCWEALLHDGGRDPASTEARWREQWTRALRAAAPPLGAWELLWQRAHEISYQDRLFGLLAGAAGRPRAPQPRPAPTAQLVFCIDVRSERLRRALEATDAALETRGFAGFFGLPIEYRPIGAALHRPRMPGLLAPTLEAGESTGRPQDDERVAERRLRSLGARAAWQPFVRFPAGAFAFVESLGLGYAAAMLRRHFAGTASSPLESFGLDSRDAGALRLRLLPGERSDTGVLADLLADILQAMSLTRDFAPLLVLVGHGSQSANNPHAAALDCGACGGHTGEVNARLLAHLLNDEALRTALGERGIHLPPGTLAVAALHNTTTDEVTLLDAAQLPASHAPALARLKTALETASHLARVERAPALGLGRFVADPGALLGRLRRRARDWAETRPEWGLAGNAAFIIAPRSRTVGVDLAGRCFLHDYEPTRDADGKVLELIMSAPMVVAHWINLQYYASTVDPERFGSGNKVLHNVACGRIGVFEGNTGDLRIGLPRQSVHDGQRWMHTPLRLSVVIDAPAGRIDAVLAKHAVVRQLVGNEWLHLFRFADDGAVEWYREGRWEPWLGGSAAR